MGNSIKYNHSKKADKIYESKEIDWDAWEKEWDRRKNTEFGKLLTELNDIVFDWFGEYDDYGFKSTPISEIMLEYFDGENNLIGLVNHIKRVLENYDMMQEDDVRKIINRLNRIARNNKDKDLLESLVEKYGAKEVESAINRLNENSNINYTFSDFWHLLDDYAYYNGQYKPVVGKYTINIKDIFGVDTLKCTSINHGTHLVLAQWIYPTAMSGLEIGIWCGKDGWEYISTINDLERFFGKNNLMKIYNYIKK